MCFVTYHCLSQSHPHLPRSPCLSPLSLFVSVLSASRPPPSPFSLPLQLHTLESAKDSVKLPDVPTDVADVWVGVQDFRQLGHIKDNHIAVVCHQALNKALPKVPTPAHNAHLKSSHGCLRRSLF